VLRQNLTRATRFLRRRRAWRQRDLAERSGVSRETISRVERGEIDGVTVGFLDRLASALGATLFIELRLHGEQLDRLMDSGHAALEQLIVQGLRAANWTSEVEVSFNWYGDRGRCDAVAFDPATRTLLIVEAKTRLGDVQELLGRLDVKVRLGKQIAHRIGWPEPARVIPCLVVAEGRTARRVVAAHAALFARFTHRGRAADRWLAAPDSDEHVGGLLLFEPLPDSHRATARGPIRRGKPPDSRRI
jgi:transcriptional regulator with XRE-family HTH domain